MLRKELGGWWRTTTWLIHLAIYLLVVNGLTAFDAWDTKNAGGPTAEAFVGFFVFHALFVMAGVLISAQGTIVGERQDGTAALPVVLLSLLLSVLFYLSFALWMGTLFESRTAVAALGFLMLFAQMQLGDQALGAYLPSGMSLRLTAAVAGAPLNHTLLPMAITAAFSTLFTALALHRLNNIEI